MKRLPNYAVCTTCEHAKLSLLQYPCKECIGFSHWEPDITALAKASPEWYLLYVIDSEENST